MVKMTPEQEAEYALGFGVARSDLPRAAQQAYDRLVEQRTSGGTLGRLIAHHSCAIIEAGERGLADVLGREFEPAPYVLSSVLTCCDMTTSPDGEPVPVEQRLAEIHERISYGLPVCPS